MATPEQINRNFKSRWMNNSQTEKMMKDNGSLWLAFVWHWDCKRWKRIIIQSVGMCSVTKNIKFTHKVCKFVRFSKTSDGSTVIALLYRLLHEHCEWTWKMVYNDMKTCITDAWMKYKWRNVPIYTEQIGYISILYTL